MPKVSEDTCVYNHHIYRFQYHSGKWAIPDPLHVWQLYARQSCSWCAVNPALNMDTRVLSARTVWLCLCLSAAVSAAAASRHLAANSSMQRAYPANCTPPRTEQDAKKPFCFVPVTASPQAQAFLAQAAAGSNGFGAYLVSDPLHNKASLNNIRQGFESSSAPGSRGAEKAFLQSTRNDTIAGVPVVFGTPKGVASSSSSNPVDAKLIIYLHGGGELPV